MSLFDIILHFAVKAPNLAHMYINPKRTFLAIVPSLNLPMAGVAASFQNGLHLYWETLNLRECHNNILDETV
jgi:hypothetical protein